MAELEITRDGSTVKVAPVDRIVSSNVGEMRTKVKSILTEGCSIVVMDLKDVAVVDSTGIGLLIAIHNSLSKTGGKLTVINASKDIFELFKAMRLEQHFSIQGA
jgi:serine/threonine-protein kinase RsbW